mgnify:CR=1 FL=1
MQEGPEGRHERDNDSGRNEGMREQTSAMGMKRLLDICDMCEYFESIGGMDMLHKRLLKLRDSFSRRPAGRSLSRHCPRIVGGFFCSELAPASQGTHAGRTGPYAADGAAGRR